MLRMKKPWGEQVSVSPEGCGVPVLEQFEINRGVAVPEIAAVEAEAVGLHGINGSPALNILVSEEVQWGCGLIRDAANRTRGFASGSVVLDLLSGDIERHFG